MKNILLGALAVSVSCGVDAQRLRIEFNTNGDKVIKRYSEHDNLGSLTTKLTYNEANLMLEEVYYFPDGKRPKLQHNYTFNRNRMTEDLSYLYTSKYKKFAYGYDERGNELENTKFLSDDGESWTYEGGTIKQYDRRNNTTYSKRYYPSSKINAEATYNYDYAAGTVREAELHLAGHESNYGPDNRTRNMTAEQKSGKSPMSERIATVVQRTDEYGRKVIETTFLRKKHNEQVFDSNNKLVKDVFYHSIDYVNGAFEYEVVNSFEYEYDRSGNIAQLIGYDTYYDVYQKQRFDYTANGELAREHLYESPDQVNWHQLATITHQEGAAVAYQPSAAQPTVTSQPSSSQTTVTSQPTSTQATVTSQPSGSQAPVRHGTITPTKANTSTYTSSPSVSVGTQTAPSAQLSDNALVDALAADDAQGITRVSEMYSDDAAKLQQLVKIINSTSGEKTSEAEVLSLALDLLIQTYRDDIKQLNKAHLERETSMFDD
jgi:hypothetical protein